MTHRKHYAKLNGPAERSALSLAPNEMKRPWIRFNVPVATNISADERLCSKCFSLDGFNALALTGKC